MAVEEIELTEEEKYEQERERAFFEGAGDGETIENTETEENEETDQGHQEPEGESGGDEEDPAGDESGQRENENGEGDGEGDEDPAADKESGDDPEGIEIPAATFKIKWNGEDIEVTQDELIALGQKGFDYTAKMQNVSKYRKDLEAAGITDNTLDLLKRVQSGDPMAALQYLNSLNIDPVDLIDMEGKENTFNPPRKADQEIVVSPQVESLMEQVVANPSLHSQMRRAEEVLPTTVIGRMAQDADLMYAAVQEVESGSFDQVMPRVQMRLATMSDLDREYALNSPDVFGSIYFEEKSKIGQVVTPEVPATPAAAPKPKPNMAEVGIKRTGGSERKEAVVKDAFNSDDEYQRILQKVRNSR